MGFVIEDDVLVEYNRENGETEVVIPDGVTELVVEHFADAQT